jgi:hypothetical protein
MFRITLLLAFCVCTPLSGFLAPKEPPGYAELIVGLWQKYDNEKPTGHFIVFTADGHIFMAAGADGNFSDSTSYSIDGNQIIIISNSPDQLRIKSLSATKLIVLSKKKSGDVEFRRK